MITLRKDLKPALIPLLKIHSLNHSKINSLLPKKDCYLPTKFQKKKNYFTLKNK
jgi:hypothetical protein